MIASASTYIPGVTVHYVLYVFIAWLLDHRVLFPV